LVGLPDDLACLRPLADTRLLAHVGKHQSATKKGFHCSSPCQAHRCAGSTTTLAFCPSLEVRAGHAANDPVVTQHVTTELAGEAHAARWRQAMLDKGFVELLPLP